MITAELMRKLSAHRTKADSPSQFEQRLDYILKRIVEDAAKVIIDLQKNGFRLSLYYDDICCPLFSATKISW